MEELSIAFQIVIFEIIAVANFYIVGFVCFATFWVGLGSFTLFIIPRFVIRGLIYIWKSTLLFYTSLAIVALALIYIAYSYEIKKLIK